MEFLMQKAKTECGFSDYQIKLIRYALTALIYDVSKLILFVIFFSYIGKLLHLFFALIPLICLRTKTGGIHFHSYLSCLVVSFGYLYGAVVILPNYMKPNSLMIFLLLLICAIVNYTIGPNSLTRKTPADIAFVKKAKLESFQVILILAIALFIFSVNQYLIVSFWTVVLHTIQLSLTKILKEVKNHESNR